MRFTVLSAAVLAATIGAGAVQAQGPRELPPGGYDGQQYVDGSGCVFVRAGIGGQTQWVPRIQSNRKPLCGYPPTFAKAPVEVAEPAPTVVAAPLRSPAAATTFGAPATSEIAVAPAPPPARPAPVLAAAPRPAPAAPVRNPACPADAPLARPYAVQGGGDAVLCTTRAGQPTTRAVSAPALPAAQAGTTLICPAGAPLPRRFGLAGGGTTVLCTRRDGSLDRMALPLRRTAEGATVMAAAPAPAAPATVAAVAPLPAVPKGYKLAWDDGRLNPNRGLGTAAGQAAQDQVWTRETPAQLVADVAKPPRTTTRITASTKGQPAKKLTVSTRSAATAPVAGGAYVQIGTFGVPANAEGAKARLAALGLPVSTGSVTKGGKALKIVYAGPFANSEAAAAALQAARGADFGDAFIR